MENPFQVAELQRIIPTLSLLGAGTATLAIPSIRALRGLRLYTGFAVIDLMTGSVDDFSTSFTFSIE